MIKIKISNKIKNFKQKVSEYFLMKNSLQTFSNAMKNYFVISIGFDEIYNGIKKSKRFKMCILVCLINWFGAFYHLIWTSSDYLWSKTNGPFLPDKSRIACLGIVILFFYIGVFKTDLALGEINSNLSPFKVFYPLMDDAKAIHKLTDRNYKKLAILSRIIVIFAINYTASILIFLTILWETIISIKSCQLYWFIYEIIMTPAYVSIVMAYATGGCFVYTYFPYYKFRFDQLNDQIKAIIPNGKGKIINFKIEKQLISLIDEHNQLAMKVNGMNLMIRRTAAAFFITLSLVKIISLYLIIYMNHLLIRIIVINIFFAFFFFGFGMSLAFSLQIKSAHQCYKLIYSIVIKHRMRLSFRLKVSTSFIKLTKLTLILLVTKFHRKINWTTNRFVLL